MSSSSDFEEYLAALLEAIIAGRISAKEARAMSSEEHAAYKEELLRDERAELERGKELLRESAPADGEKVPGESLADPEGE